MRKQIPLVVSTVALCLVLASSAFAASHHKKPKKAPITSGITKAVVQYTLNKKKIFAVFAPGAARMGKLWDKEMLGLVRSGKLKEIYLKWGLMKEGETITHYYQEGAR